MRRKSLGIKQADVAVLAGLSAESLSRFERGRTAEFGARKLLAVLAVLNAELDITATGQAGTLDLLRQERSVVGLQGSAAKTETRSNG